MRFVFIFLSLVLISLPATVLAQDAAILRVGQHDDHTRMVFDWQDKTAYDLREDADGKLQIVFQTDKDINTSEYNPARHVFVKSLDISASEGGAKAVTIGRDGDYRFRHFIIGNKVIVDVFGDPAKVPSQSVKTDTSKPDKKSDKPAVSEAPARVPEITEVSEVIVPEVPAPQSPEFNDDNGPAIKIDTVVDEGKATLLDQAMGNVGSHVITMSSTQSFGLAAFIRGDRLWLVADRSDLKIPPEIAGPDKDEFGPFQRYDLQGGLAYTTKLPEAQNLKVYGEGGGLVWRVVVTPDGRKVKATDMQRSFRPNSTLRGGTVIWPFRSVTKVLSVPDPVVGDIMKVATVEGSAEFAGKARDLVDLETFDSAIGLAVRAKVDDLTIKSSIAGVEISRPVGLALSRPSDVSRSVMRDEITNISITTDLPDNVIIDEVEPDTDTPKVISRIFDFDRWMMGGIQALDENQRILLTGMTQKDTNGLVQDLITLAKINIANNRGQEAIGFLRYAQQELPDITENPEFKALRGAAYALSGKYELALQDLLSPSLKGYEELDYWRAFTLAWLEDWVQAYNIVPKDYSVLVGYPLPLLEKMGVKLAEAVLRGGDEGSARSILATLQKDEPRLENWTKAGIDYLRGEAHRQSEEFEEARDLWTPLLKSEDDFYRARAGLALTLLELQTEEISIDKAIDRLEGLRYVWRGDELEAQINFTLGRLYVDQDRYLKGFNILREAASLNPNSDIGTAITDYMGSEFSRLLLEDEDLSPIDAVTVYEEFTELTPLGPDGNKVVQRLAERLVDADLLDRATNLLQYQVDFRLDGVEKARIALRTATIYLVNDQPEKALPALNTAKAIYETVETDEAKAALYRIELMRAKALAQADKVEEALALLLDFTPSPDVNRLRADIAWEAGLWEDAAEALQDLILDEGLDLERPLTPEQADLILHRSVALNLSTNRVALSNMRKRYLDSMKRTARARLFDVVTRPRQSGLLTDRDTLNSIVSEVDIFKDFLDSYRESDLFDSSN